MHAYLCNWYQHYIVHMYIHIHTISYNVMLRLKDPSQYVREHQGGSELCLKILYAVYDPTTINDNF